MTYKGVPTIIDLQLAPSKKKRKPLPKEECSRCEALITKAGMYRHRQTLICITIAKDVELRRAGWVDFWESYFSSKRPWFWEERPASEKHIRRVPSGYHYGGWGAQPSTYNKTYMRSSFVTLYESPIITRDELLECCVLDETDPRYQALYVMASLAQETNDDM